MVSNECLDGFVVLAETGRSCATSKGGDKSQVVSLSGVGDHRRPGHETAASFKVSHM